MSRFSYLGQDEPDEEPQRVEKIKKKPKPFDDGTSRQKPNSKRRRPKRKK